MEINQENKINQPQENQEAEKKNQNNTAQISSQNLFKLKKLYKQCSCYQCQLLYEHPITIPCGHTFCRECIIRFIELQPLCPQCQYPVTINILNISENILAKSIVKEFSDLFIKHQNQPKKVRRFDYIVDKPQMKKFMQQQFIFFLTKQIIIPYIVQTVELELGKNQGNHEQWLIKILQPESFVVLSNSYTQDEANRGSIVRILGLTKNGSKILFNIKAEEEIKILKLTNSQCQIQQEIQLYIVKVQPIIQEVIEFNYDTDTQIQHLLDSIFNSLSIHIPQQVNSVSSLSCFTFIQKLGIMRVLKSNIKRDQKTLNQISFIIPSILNINDQERQRIYNSDGLIQRLMLISAALKKFENITNPFVVFKIPGDKTRGNQYTEFLVIICLFIFAFYYRVVGF